MLYIINISRFVIGFIFFYSFVSKLRDVAGFENTIKNFQLLPNSLRRLTAIGFMLGEALIVVAALLGGNWLLLCYGLAIGLLLLFMYALHSVLQRKIQTACNCFGASEQKVSAHDIWRNGIIIMVACTGLMSFFFNTSSINLSLLDGLFSAIVALTLSLLLLNLREILELVT